MKVNRGCGCVLLLLALIDLILVASPIIAIASKKATVWVSLVMLVVFASNAVACFLLGWPSLRAGGMRQSTDSEGEAGEGVDEEPQGDERNTEEQ